MKLSTMCLCLVLLLAVTAATSRTVTDGEKTKINEGIEAAKDLTNTMQTAKNISTVLEKMTDTVGPWADGIETFMEVLGFFSPGEKDVLDEMKKGFMEVSGRLDYIQKKLRTVKGKIDWSVVKVNLLGIEDEITLLDTKLDEVLEAANLEEEKQEYIRVYENEYNEAGQHLWDSIVNNDQDFYENIVAAGMKYSNYRRGKMDKFMRGLIALILKATNIDVSYEKFKQQDSGMVGIWKTRLSETRVALAKADKVLENAWKDLFRGEVDSISKDLEGWDHVNFCSVVHRFLDDKYYWKNWSVLVYDDVEGFENHAISYLPEQGHHRFHHYGRNFMIACSDPDASFDHQRAQSEIRDKICPSDINVCERESALHVLNLTPFIGVAKAALNYRVSPHAIGVTNRMAWGSMYLRKDTWGKKHYVFYFG